MAENKKDKSAEFARDKSAFDKGGSEKGTASQKAQHKHSGTHQPRDANDTSRDVPKKEQPETFGQNVQKSGQSAKRRNKKQYQKQDTFGHSENPSAEQKNLKSENMDADSKGKSDFSQENNTFTEDCDTEQEEHQQKDDYHRRDTYHQSQKKGKYHRREYQNRERTKQSDFERDFQTKEKTFTEGAEPEFHGNKKLDRLQSKAEKAGKKTEVARKKIPKTKEYSFERVFDEKTGKARYVLTAVEKEKQFKPDSPVKVVAGRVGAEYSNFAHGKVAEVEKENSAVEGAHKTEQTAEDVDHFVKRNHKSRLQRKKEKDATLEKKQFKKEVNFRYQKFLEENPEMQEQTLKKQMQKRLQKQRIKREYAKARRAGQASKNTKEAAAKSANFITKVAKKIQEIASRNVSLLVTIGIFALLLIMIMTAISSCGAMFSDGMSTTLAGSYMSVPAEIDAADLAFSELEMKLQKQINNIETDYPDYDEYRYNLDAIGHDPFVLISYLSAVHTEFTASDVQSEIESLFEEMYELTLNPTTETRTRTVTDPETGEETEEEYTVTILEVTLTATDLGVVVAGHMNEEQKEIYALYTETHGLTQQFYTPLNLYWYSYVSSYYGYRINPVTGQEQFHRGVDIVVPTGTTVLAAMDGTVTTATYDASYGNYVVIEDSNGYCTKYAHMDTLNVSAGQTVTHGTTIGTTGNTGSSTGSNLHIECLYNGEYYNPLFYFDVGEGTLYGESPGGGGSPGNVIPPDSYDDATVQALMEEAARYLNVTYDTPGKNQIKGL